MKTKRLFFISFLLPVVLFSTGFAQDTTETGLPGGAIARLGKGGINLMRFSPDGTRLAVGTDVGVWLYDVPNGKETTLFTEHTAQVNALAFSKDGKMLASSGYTNPVIQLWDLDTLSKLSSFTLAARHDSVTVVAFSDDSTTLVSLDTLGDIIYWDVNTNSKVSDAKNIGSYEVAALSENGSILAIGDKDGEKIHVWETAKGRWRVTFRGHVNFFKEGPDADEKEADIRALAFTPDGKMLASGSEDKTVQLWNTQNGAKIATFKGHEGWVTTVALTADGGTVASGDADRVIKIWDVDTEREHAMLIGHKNTINALAFAPEGASPYSGCLASGSADGTIRFWDPETGRELATFTTGHTEWVKAVAFSKDGATLTSAGHNGNVDVWSLMTRRELITFTTATAGHSDLVKFAVFSPNSRFFATQGYSGPIAFDAYGWGVRYSFKGRSSMQLWNVGIGTNEELRGISQQIADTTETLKFSPDSKMLATRGPKNIQAWNMETGIELFHINTGNPFPRQLMFSSDRTLLAAYGPHGVPRVWDTGTRSEFPTFTTERAKSLAFSPDGATLALGHRNSITLWNVTKTGMQERKMIHSNIRPFNHVLLFSPDGKILLDAYWSGRSSLQLWAVDTGRSLGVLSGHTEPIETLVFSPDEKTLASGSQDGTVLLWDWNSIAVNIKDAQSSK